LAAPRKKDRFHACLFFFKFIEFIYVVQLNVDKEDLKVKRKVTTIDEVEFELYT